MKWSETITEISKALAAFNAEVENPTKDKTADAGKYSYRFSDLGDLTSLVRPILAKHGVSALQELISEDTRTGAKTVLLHTSGEFIEFEPVYITHRSHPQDIGSACTYARRYSLLAALGIAPEDDDGAAAQRGFENQGSPAEPTEPPRAHPSVIQKIRELRVQAGVPDDKYAEQLEHYGVTVDIDLKTPQALELKRAYEEHIKKQQEAAQ